MGWLYGPLGCVLWGKEMSRERPQGQIWVGPQGHGCILVAGLAVSPSQGQLQRPLPSCREPQGKASPHPFEHLCVCALPVWHPALPTTPSTSLSTSVTLVHSPRRSDLGGLCCVPTGRASGIALPALCQRVLSSPLCTRKLRLKEITPLPQVTHVWNQDVNLSFVDSRAPLLYRIPHLSPGSCQSPHLHPGHRCFHLPHQ